MGIWKLAYFLFHRVPNNRLRENKHTLREAFCRSSLMKSRLRELCSDWE